MFEKCLKPQLLPVLDMLVASQVLESSGFYLAGGTALALQFGHRISEDLDFFSSKEFEPQTIIAQLDQARLQIINMDDKTLNMLMDSQKVSFFYYPYPSISSFLEYRGCLVADHLDIAAMKIIAIAQRGSKKDFVDFHSLLTSTCTFDQIINCLKQKYPRIEYNSPHLIRSIGYFEDAEKEAMPLMNRGDHLSILTQKEWEKIKADIIDLQKTALKTIIESQ